MIQEKDFLYRVPVKTAPITTPRGQIRNPEILVDLEGGEFMHGNILDANSTNKLINQSVKDAVDDKLNESGHVTKDLLEAETSARTKGDEDLSAKIKAEQTRAEGKEKEISDKLAIVDGDSNTEGSFRKAITEKADASALANEVARATGAESGLQAAIATKADATALSNYVLTTALNQQVDTLNTAISAKQDAGNYIPYNDQYKQAYMIDRTLKTIGNNIEVYSSDSENDQSKLQPGNLLISKIVIDRTYRAELNTTGLTIKNDDGDIFIDNNSFRMIDADNMANVFSISESGVQLRNGDDNHVLTSNASTIDITQYALKTELPTVPTKTSQLTNDSNFITASATTTPKAYEINRGITLTNGVFKTKGIESTNYASFSSNALYFQDESDRVIYGANGIHSNQYRNCVLTTDNEFKSITDFASAEQLQSVQSGLSAKQNKITVNEVDITDIKTADIARLRTIVINLINALNESDLIRQIQVIE